MRSKLLAGGVLAWAVLTVSPASATQVFYVPLEQMARDADVIVYARVGDQNVTWDETGSRVLTLTRIQVLRGIKNAQKGETMTIYQVGGTLDGVTFKIPGALRFEPGEEMVFFAMRFRDMLVSYGMGLGKYAVRAEGGKHFAAPEHGDVAWVERTAQGWSPTAAPAVAAVPLSQLIDRVQRAVAPAGKGDQ